jgi:MFS family permease
MQRPLLPLFLTVFVDVLGLTIILPLLPYYAQHFGAPPLLVGLLGATYAACQLVSGPILGRISDVVGRKPTLLVSQAGTFVGFLIIGSAQALWMLFLGRIIDGFTAGNLSIAQAYISDVTKPEERTKAFGLIGISFGMGFLIGPAISGVLAARYGYGAPAYAAAGLSATSILVTATLLPAKPPLAVPLAAGSEAAPRRSLDLGRFFRRPEPRTRLLQFFAYTLAFATLFGTGLALFLSHQPGLRFDVRQTGWVYAYAGLLGAIIQGGMLGRLVKRYGEERLAAAGFALMALGYGMLGAAHTTAVLLGLITIGSMGVGLGRPCITTLLTQSVGRDEQGAALGTSQSLGSIAQIVGQVLAGALIGHGLLYAYGLAGAAFALVGLAVSLMWRRRAAAV